MNPELEQKIIREIPPDDSTSHGEKMLLYWLIRELKPHIVVETGTHRGMTTLYLAAALSDNAVGGTVFTSDPNDEWGQRGNFSKFVEELPQIVFSKQQGIQMLENVQEPIDFAFIDGFHGKDDVLPEIAALLPKLAERAVVVFHDCWYGNTDGVNEALEEAGLHTIWLPTKNAVRIYSKYDEHPTH